MECDLDREISSAEQLAPNIRCVPNQMRFFVETCSGQDRRLHINRNEPRVMVREIKCNDVSNPASMRCGFGFLRSEEKEKRRESGFEFLFKLVIGSL